MLSVEAVSKTFGGVQALRQASLPGLWIGCPPPWSHVSGPELQ